jgi:RND family efflux transporter MFP subunit
MKKLIVLIILVALYSCSNKPSNDSKSSNTNDTKVEQKGKNKKGGDKDEEEIIINIEAATVYAGDAVSVFKTTTILEADLESAVTSKASGIVLQLKAEVGDEVKAGDVLAVLESDIQQLNYKSANANYQKSLHNYNRAKTLLKKGLANKESVDNLKFETESLKTSLSQATLDLEFTKIKAPISGIITKRNIKKGNLIQQNTEAYEIVDFNSLQAVINIPESKWGLFKKGLDVSFQFSSIAETIMGHIQRIDPTVDSSTGTFKAVIAIDDTKVRLRPGLFGKTHIILDRHENTLLLSKNAVIREDEKAYVYTINKDKTVSKTDILIGYEMDDYLEVVSGLTVDQQVVTTGKNNVSEESTVEIIEYND